ncbi:helix-turn-helix domain-containing protein [Sphingobium sp.]|jgi:excisionase family DNA binding protein|uniref:helix-turn-helix domain-containing protein n=1 Tax=Sphingobium sp. TaxID=1912891 RepID=UPI003BB59E2E
MVHVIKTRRGSAAQMSGDPPDPVCPQPEPLTVRIPAAVRMTGIGRSKLYELIQSGDIDIVKIGASTLIPVDSLRKLIDRHRR